MEQIQEQTQLKTVSALCSVRKNYFENSITLVIWQRNVPFIYNRVQYRVHDKLFFNKARNLQIFLPSL